jgi:hypothetical protein
MFTNVWALNPRFRHSVEKLRVSVMSERHVRESASLRRPLRETAQFFVEILVAFEVRIPRRRKAIAAMRGRVDDANIGAANNPQDSWARRQSLG